ncbi:MAG TPA: hypothetical protein VM198_00250 [Longimicrobiales bacterium]|nr:hypothetical protein [Longimicrobiales bacterium]
MPGIGREAGSRSWRAVRRGVAAGLGAATVAVVLATPAVAAQPNNQACLGEDIRSYAQGGSMFGTFVSAMASTGNGIGTEIQAHLAGQIPDAQLPNSCND